MESKRLFEIMEGLIKTCESYAIKLATDREKNLEWVCLDPESEKYEEQYAINHGTLYLMNRCVETPFLAMESTRLYRLASERTGIEKAKVIGPLEERIRMIQKNLFVFKEATDGNTPFTDKVIEELEVYADELKNELNDLKMRIN